MDLQELPLALPLPLLLLLCMLRVHDAAAAAGDTCMGRWPSTAPASCLQDFA